MFPIGSTLKELNKYLYFVMIFIELLQSSGNWTLLLPSVALRLRWANVLDAFSVINYKIYYLPKNGHAPTGGLRYYKTLADNIF